MAKQYTIDAVSEKVKNWDSRYGPMVTYSVRLEGEGHDAIQLNKKSDSPIPKEGDELYGEITETEFGKKFKSEQRPDGGSTTSQPKRAYQDNSKNITLGLVWKTIAGIRGLPENDEDFARFYEIVNAHYTELILMQEKVKSEE